MDRFTIKRKISDTLLGATYECRFNASPPQAKASTHRSARSSVALKCSSLARRKRLLTTLQCHARPDGNNNDDDDDDTTLDDPERERRVVAALIASGGHTNVLQCYNQFTARDDASGDEYVCHVTEFCEGGDLFGYMSSSPTRGVGEREAVALMLQVARGVAFLQSRLGFAHRDLSLENVLLRHGTCKVADFGLAVPLRERCRGVAGKAAYMAPEVVASRTAQSMKMKKTEDKDDDVDDCDVGSACEGYDPASADVWSLGVMLFMLLTGSPLVTNASAEDAGFVAVVERGVCAILDAWGIEATSGLVKLLDAMLREDPMQRPTVRLVVKILEELDAAARDNASRRRCL